MSSVIRIGPAGWQYKDWNGVVYPKGAGSKFNQLQYIANFFDTAEINTSFYGPPRATSAKAWLQSVSHNPRFKFTAKLYRKFTHERPESGRLDEDWRKAVIDFRAGMDPLAKAGALGAVLLQFPWSFKYDVDNRKYLALLLDVFKDYPLAVELRHSTWNESAVYEELEQRGVGFCNIDQPLFHNSIKPSALTTSPIGYVRLHGRNYGDWFRKQAGRDARYDYLYSPKELEPWIKNIEEISSLARETYAVANNHFRGQAIVNALEIKSRILGKKVAGPPQLLLEYPRLKEVADPKPD
jgi:uncharacterized protein YecE (DUF72 family)